VDTWALDHAGDVAGLDEEVRESAGRDTGVAEHILERERRLRQVLACLSRIGLPSTRFGAAIRTTGRAGSSTAAR
jgi:hypothetical protein